MKNIAYIFHQSTNTKYQDGMTKSREIPQEWKTVYFKEYPRLEKVLLLRGKKINFSLGDALNSRTSERNFSGKAISFSKLSQLLFYSAGIVRKEDDDWNKTRRAYPSAGARFPLELYLINFIDGEKLKEGIYHYNIKGHFLERFSRAGLLKDIYPKIVWQDMILKSSMLFVISAVFNRNMMKYKDRGYRYILFESGHFGQNIYMISSALGLKCCAIGAFDDDELNKLIDVNTAEESAIYLFAMGS